MYGVVWGLGDDITRGKAYLVTLPERLPCFHHSDYSGVLGPENEVWPEKGSEIKSFLAISRA